MNERIRLGLLAVGMLAAGAVVGAEVQAAHDARVLHRFHLDVQRRVRELLQAHSDPKAVGEFLDDRGVQWDEGTASLQPLPDVGPELLQENGLEWNEELGLVTHSADSCQLANGHCPVHNPSDHPLRDAPRNWRGDRGLMERVCDHGIGHPDPDDLAFKEAVLSEEEYDSGAWGVHGCDGCCS